MLGTSSSNRRRWFAAIGLPSVLITSAFFVGSASAGPGDVVQNPGPVTMIVNGGGFINLAGKSFPLASLATPKQCADGINNDVDAADATKAQDLNVDFAKPANWPASGPAWVKDPQCNGAPGFLGQDDDSEVKGGNQPRQYITLAGNVDKDGNISVPQAGLSFPKFYIYVNQSGAGLSIDVVPSATGPATGTVNPATGVVNLHVEWQLEILETGLFGIDCATKIAMDLSSDPASPANSGSIPTSPSPYDPKTGSATVSGNQFTASEIFIPGGLTERATGRATAASTTFTDPSGTFSADNVGNLITIKGAGASGADLGTKITSVTNATTVVLAAAPATTKIPATYSYGKSTTALCDLVKGGFGVPAAAGQSAAQMTVTSSVAFTPGAAVATADSGTTAFNTALTVAAPGVLANDKGAALKVTGNTEPSHGTLVIGADGAYTYTPAAGYAGADSFTYTVTDSTARTATATVSLTVSPPDAPVAANDAYDAGYGTPLVTAPPGVLANDSGAALSVTANTAPAHGTVTQNADGSFTYVPSAGYAGADSYGYTVTDAVGQTANATVNITVATPAGPTAADDEYAVGYQTALTTDAPGVLINDTGTAISITGHTNPAHGTVTQNADGGFTYTPAAGYAGADSYTYTVTDAFARSATATVGLTVNSPGGPVATADAYSTPFQTALTTGAPGVLGNDTGTGITVTANTDPGHGTVAQKADGSFTYTPADGFSGADSFTYTVTDGFARTSTATVSLTVDAPTVQPGINGKVTDAGGRPLAGIVVTLLKANPSWEIVGSTTTDAAGTYHVGGLANGQYAARFWDGTGMHETLWYNSKPTYKTATLLTIASPSDAVDADQRLGAAPTGGITGRAQTAAFKGIPNISVTIYTESNGFYAAATTGALGYYQFNHVPAGNYYVRFEDPSGTYRSQWYNFKQLTADLLPVGADVVRADAMLG